MVIRPCKNCKKAEAVHNGLCHNCERIRLKMQELAAMHKMFKDDDDGMVDKS